jgi:hypothetical protein
MFTMKIVDSDAFLEMPMSTQALYFHLNMRADDDGFINNPKKIARMIGASDDDIKLLIAKRFVLCYENGIVVIKHWRMHNLLRKDRYNPTQYVEEKAMLSLESNGAYTENDSWQPNGNQMAPQDRIGKVRLDKDSIGESSIDKTMYTTPKEDQKHIFGEYKHVRLTDKELQKLKDEFGEVETDEAIVFLDEYIEMKGYKAKSHYLAIRKWVFDAVREDKARKAPKSQKAQELNDFYNMAKAWAERED